MIKIRRELFSIPAAARPVAGILSAVSLAVLAGCAAPPVAKPVPTGWVADEVADSYVFGYPLVLMDVARTSAVGDAPGQAPVNALRDAQALPPVGTARPPRASVDTIDTTGWLDVGAEPVIVTLPDSHGRYIDARVLDMWTNVVWSSTSTQTGSRVTGIKSQTIAFVGPGWKGKLPSGVKRVDVATRNLWFVARIQTAGGRDMAAVRKLQGKINVEPLSDFIDSGTSPGTPARNGVDTPSDATPAAQVAALDARAFFNRLAKALEDNPPTTADQHAMKILADIGVTPGEAAALPGGASAAIASGLAAGHERVAMPPSNLLTGNGWSWFGDGVGSYGPDYALRAYASYAEPGIGTREDEVRAIVTQDSDGHPLNGSNRYTIHFEPNGLPPVRGFWSITAYTKEGALGESAPSRLSIGDRSGARRNRDGSLDITIAPTRPRAANWLPAPRGDMQLELRIYAPKPQATEGTWQPPAVVRE
ncbi:DUF1254 domain-containing protein [Paraburkholderia sp.]|uniref:DUF1254 domain-containing protein n=1 Tax=Paraburkholderia sp. TaxID=1926495 RepID=UPI0023965614|nr:DUF1254 domain-containing protein [Paraburkholderia sp.]MDE1182016.1 DUF1214 domain-containing protein [Paraburkholderia sp.]